MQALYWYVLAIITIGCKFLRSATLKSSISLYESKINVDVLKKYSSAIKFFPFLVRLIRGF